MGLPSPWDRFLYDTSRAKWPRYALYPLDKALLAIRGVLMARRNGSETILCETPHHALVGLFIARVLGARCVWDSHGSVRIFSKSMGKGPIFTTLAVALERFVGKRVDALIAVSDSDRSDYVDLGIPPERVFVVPHCVDLRRIDAHAGTSRRVPGPPGATSGVPVLLFFGSFRYDPNLEALRYIEETLVPFLQARGTQGEIRIAGRNIPDRPYHGMIRVLGFVPNIYETIASSDLCIIPVWRGVGILTKALDAMAVGTPTVLSRFAASLIPGVESGVHAFIAESPRDFPTVVLKALADPTERRRVAREARRLVETRYDWDLHGNRLAAIVRGDGPAGG